MEAEILRGGENDGSDNGIEFSARPIRRQVY